MGNTYCLTKALGEALLHRDRGAVPLAIIRPTTIVSAHKDPMPGWSENLSGLLAIHMFALMGCCPVGPHHVLFSLITAHVSEFI
jgi:nucleoside-diphosphate-sugar epimerase